MSPEEKRIHSLRSSANKLGFNADDVVAWYHEHDGLCDICRRPPYGRGSRLSIDHDHASGEFRGLICSPCNTILGMAGDDIERLKAAIKYLRKVRT